MKDPATYEHIAPETVGNRRKVLVSDQAGKSNVLAELERVGLKVNKDDPRIGRLLEVVKEREAIGYAYETADASFELLARRMLGTVPKFFDVTYFDVKVEQRGNGSGGETLTTAVVKVKVGDETLISAAEGNGPVNALDVALRKDLGKYQKYIEGLKLTDYRVRILNSGTEAVTRVLIESEDESGERWTTIGVSAEHHRRFVPGLDGFHHHQAVAGRRAGVSSTPCVFTMLLHFQRWAFTLRRLPSLRYTRANAAPAEQHREFIAAAFKMRDDAVRAGDQAYGAVVVKDGRIIGFGPSRVVLKKDWTAHAEREAIREAQARLGRTDLSGACSIRARGRVRPARPPLTRRRLRGCTTAPDATDAGAPRRS